MGIDKHLTEPLILGQILREHIQVDYGEPDGLAYLRRSETNTF